MIGIIGLAEGDVRLVPHHPQWQELFHIEKERIQAHIGSHILDIQHVGSTAISGIVAKPILDIAVAVENFEEAAGCIEPMASLGYVYQGEKGIPRRRFFVKQQPTDTDILYSTHHVHMNELGCVDWENQILFRDYLLRHPDVAQEYATLKFRLGEEYATDRKQYVSGKSTFITDVLAYARAEKEAESPSMGM
ncbi:MAG: GrpB family protein [Chloroflexota bacterium]